MVPRLIAAAALLAAFSTAAAAKSVTLGAETNLRKAPGTKSEVVTLMPKGAAVEVGDCDAGWCTVNWNGQNGYAIARNLGLAPRRAAAVRRPPPGYPVYEDEDGYDDGPPIVYEDGPPPPYVVGPPVYYGYFGYPRPWGWGGYRHHHWHRW